MRQLRKLQQQQQQKLYQQQQQQQFPVHRYGDPKEPAAAAPPLTGEGAVTSGGGQYRGLYEPEFDYEGGPREQQQGYNYSEDDDDNNGDLRQQQLINNNDDYDDDYESGGRRPAQDPYRMQYRQQQQQPPAYRDPTPDYGDEAGLSPPPGGQYGLANDVAEDSFGDFRCVIILYIHIHIIQYIYYQFL